MGVIESEEAAKRLARVIVSDIEIYNREKFQTGADLTNAIEEGRALFRSRVAPELLPVFTSVLEDRRVASRKQKADAKRAASEAASAERIVAPAVSAVQRPPEVTVAPVAPAVHTAPPRPAEMLAPEPSEPAPHAPSVRNEATTPAQAASEAITPVPTVLAPEPSAAPAVVAEAAVAPPPAAASPPAAAPSPPAAAPSLPASAPSLPAAAPPGARPASPAARGGIIDTEEAAARLARVILSDVEIYNAKKLASGLDLTSEIEEGRALFNKRVSPELKGIFDTALATKGLGQRRRTASPVPVPKPRPVAAPVEPIAARPAPAAAAPAVAPAPLPPLAPAAPAAVAPAPAPAPRPSISAAKAPPASQPRPGVSAPRPPAPAPFSVPVGQPDSGSARHFSPPAAHAAPAHQAPQAFADGGSAPRHLPGAQPPVGASYRSATAFEGPTDDSTPTPGMVAGIAFGATPAPSEAVPASSPRTTTSRPAATPPPVPHPARPSQQMRVPTPVPHHAPIRRERLPSAPELPILVDSGPHRHDSGQLVMPPQEVLDALPGPAPLPPLPRHSASAMPVHLDEPHLAPPAAGPLAVAPQIATPPSLLPAPAPIDLADYPPAAGEEVVSLRRGMSKTRLLLTVAALGSAGGAIWYFLMR